MNEQQKRNELGNIYGSRISKNGNWLNLLIVTHINGEDVRITCPVRLLADEDAKQKKPYAVLEYERSIDNERFLTGKAIIANLPVYDDKKPTEAQAAADDNDLPF